VRQAALTVHASQKVLIRSKAAEAKDFINQRSRRNGIINEETRSKNRNKSRIRARVPTPT